MSSKFFNSKVNNKTTSNQPTSKNTPRSGAKKTIVQKAGRGK